MHEVRKLTTVSGSHSFTVVDEVGLPVADVDNYLDYLDAVESSENTQKAAAYDLMAWMNFLAHEGIGIADVTAEHLGRFVRHLRRPAAEVPIITEVAAARTKTTVNRMMSTVGAFYRHRADLGDSHARYLVAHSKSQIRRQHALLDGVARPLEDRVVGPRLQPEPRHLELLTIPQARTIINATSSRRDRFFISLLLMTGIRRGQALGLRHSDFNTRERWMDIVSRTDNANGARSKRGKSRRLPIQRDLARLYLDYMNNEYGDLDSDYVFVSLRGPSRGTAMSFDAVDALVKRLRARTEISGWSCHTFRHTWATLHLRAGMRLEVISHLLMHGNPKTTAETYTHLDLEDLRAELIATGCWAEEDDRELVAD